MKHLKNISEAFKSRVIKFTSKRNPSQEVIITVEPLGRISSIQNTSGIRFPFEEGQTLNRNVETWACNMVFLMNGEDTCPEKKIFGIRTSDIPQGHEWRYLYPQKFRK